MIAVGVEAPEAAGGVAVDPGGEVDGLPGGAVLGVQIFPGAGDAEAAVPVDCQHPAGGSQPVGEAVGGLIGLSDLPRGGLTAAAGLHLPGAEGLSEAGKGGAVGLNEPGTVDVPSGGAHDPAVA